MCEKNRLIYCTLLGWHNGIERGRDCQTAAFSGRLTATQG